MVHSSPNYIAAPSSNPKLLQRVREPRKHSTVALTKAIIITIIIIIIKLYSDQH